MSFKFQQRMVESAKFRGEISFIRVEGFMFADMSMSFAGLTLGGNLLGFPSLPRVYFLNEFSIIFRNCYKKALSRKVLASRQQTEQSIVS